MMLVLIALALVAIAFVAIEAHQANQVIRESRTLRPDHSEEVTHD